MTTVINGKLKWWSDLIAVVVVLYTKGLRGYGGLVIGGIVGLDIFFLAFISGASMNPAR